MAEYELVKKQNERKQGLIVEYLSKHPKAGVTELCRLVDISVPTLYKWIEKFPEFAEKMLDTRMNRIEEEVEAAENTVFTASREGDVHAAMQVLKNLGKHRGWGDKLQVDHKANNQPIEGFEVVVIHSRPTQQLEDIPPTVSENGEGSVSSDL